MTERADLDRRIASLECERELLKLRLRNVERSLRTWRVHRNVYYFDRVVR